MRVCVCVCVCVLHKAICEQKMVILGLRKIIKSLFVRASLLIVRRKLRVGNRKNEGQGDDDTRAKI